MRPSRAARARRRTADRGAAMAIRGASSRDHTTAIVPWLLTAALGFERKADWAVPTIRAGPKRPWGRLTEAMTR